MNKLFSVLAALVLLTGLAFSQAVSPSGAPRGGQVFAVDYNFGGNFEPGGVINWATVTTGNTTAGAAGTLIVSYGNITMGNGRTVMPFAINAPVLIDDAGNQETQTPSAVSCGTPQVTNTCMLTFTSLTYVHGSGTRLASGTGGLQEAINDTWQQGGGLVVVDQAWARYGFGTNAMLTSALPYNTVAIEDRRAAAPVYWQPGATATTVLAAPTTLVAGTAGAWVGVANGVAGSASNGATMHLCISYVDIMGNEGPCSADFSATGVTLEAMGYTAPAASAGAVGYTIYESLSGGTYTLAYKIPITSAVCTLTQIETSTAACAVANTTYGQTGSGAVVTGYPVNTSPTAINSGVISTTAITHGNANGRTTYGYVPGSKLSLVGLQGTAWPFPTAAAAGSTVPSVLGTITVPSGFMNFVGRSIRVCGYGTMSGASTATVLELSLQWDAFGQNNAGLPVTVADAKVTPASAFASSVVNASFCFTLSTQVASQSVTGGTLIAGPGTISFANTAPGVSPSTGPIITTAAVGSLNLSAEARLHIVYTHVTGTDAAGFVLNNVTVEGL